MRTQFTPTWDELPGEAANHISDLEEIVRTLAAGIDSTSISRERIVQLLEHAESYATDALKDMKR